MKIDAFPHIFPKPFFDRMLEVAPDKGAIKRWLHIPSCGTWTRGCG